MVSRELVRVGITSTIILGDNAYNVIILKLIKQEDILNGYLLQNNAS